MIKHIHIQVTVAHSNTSEFFFFISSELLSMPAVKRFSVSFAKHPTNGTSASFKYFSTSPPFVLHVFKLLFFDLGFYFFHMALQHSRFPLFFFSNDFNFFVYPYALDSYFSNTTWHSLSNQGSHWSLNLWNIKKLGDRECQQIFFLQRPHIVAENTDVFTLLIPVNKTTTTKKLDICRDKWESFPIYSHLAPFTWYVFTS